MDQDTTVLNLQTVLFVNNLNLTNKLDLARDILQSSTGLYDGDPLILPLPPNAPPEIPRLRLKNSDETFVCNISMNRIDCIYNSTPQSVLLPQPALSEKYQSAVADLAEVIKANYGATIFRLGFIPSFMIELHNQTSGEYIQQNFIKAGTFRHAVDFQLNVLNRYTNDDFELNKWIKFNQIRMGDEKTNKSRLVILFDINTVTEVFYNLGGPQISKFFEYAEHLIQQDLVSYHF